MSEGRERRTRVCQGLSSSARRQSCRLLTARESLCRPCAFEIHTRAPPRPLRACRNGVHRHHDDCECGPETPRGKIFKVNCSCCSTFCHCCRKKFYDRRRWTWAAGGWLNLPSDWGDYEPLPSLQVLKYSFRKKIYLFITFRLNGSTMGLGKNSATRSG